MSQDEINKALYGKTRRNKFNVGPVEDRTRDGIVFHSVREAGAYMYLKALEKAGTIRNLELQVRFPLYGVSAATGKPEKVCSYVADFVCQDIEGKTCIYDAKGMKTDLFIVKSKWFELQYGMRIILL